MLKSECFVFDNITFRRYPKSKNISDREYFKNYYYGYLHRYVYEYYFGKIPEGFHVHHKDGNKQNNDKDNLMAVNSKKHKTFHKITGKDLEKKREHLKKIRPLTKKWHASKKGHEWHKKHGKESYKKRIPLAKNCVVCGSEYEDITRRDNSHFCSNKCKSKYRRIQGLDNIIKKCPVCKIQFSTNKYREADTCSKSCANRYRKIKKNEGNL